MSLGEQPLVHVVVRGLVPGVGLEHPGGGGGRHVSRRVRPDAHPDPDAAHVRRVLVVHGRLDVGRHAAHLVLVLLVPGVLLVAWVLVGVLVGEVRRGVVPASSSSPALVVVTQMRRHPHSHSGAGGEVGGGGPVASPSPQWWAPAPSHPSVPWVTRRGMAGRHVSLTSSPSSSRRARSRLRYGDAAVGTGVGPRVRPGPSPSGAVAPGAVVARRVDPGGGRHLPLRPGGGVGHAHGGPA